MSVQAMKGGAIEFPTKPFRDQDSPSTAFSSASLAIGFGARISKCFWPTSGSVSGSLSPREREVMIEVARGRLSKQIAGDIGIAEATVKVHRSRAMRKMNARSLPELGRMADKAQARA